MADKTNVEEEADDEPMNEIEQELAALPKVATLREPALLTLLKALSGITHEMDPKLLEHVENGRDVRCEGSLWNQGLTKEDICIKNTLIDTLDKPDGCDRLRELCREMWPGRFDFLLALVGFTVDLSGIWKFPFLVYTCGGGAFFIPYTLMMAVGGLPLFYMECALGQYYKRGPITTWGRICPLFKGIGYTLVLIALYVGLYYNVVIGWCLYYFFASFSLRLPWMHCSNPWNTPNCSAATVVLSKEDSQHYHGDQKIPWDHDGTPSSLEYLFRGVLETHKSSGLDNLGEVKFGLLFCVGAVLMIGYFALWKGVMSSSKVINFMVIYPYVSLVILLLLSMTLPGSFDGIYYFLWPQFDKLLHAEVWQAAASQVFFSLGPGFGVLLSYSSYNPFNKSFHRDVIIVTMLTFWTSVIAGMVIFCGLGFICYKTKKELTEVAIAGNGLIFAVFPEVIAAFPSSTIWALLYFSTLFCLGFSSSLGGSTAIITALGDEFPVLIKRHRKKFVGGLFSLFFIFSFVCVTQGGVYVVELLDFYCAQYSILVAVFFETIAISWFYGIEQFSMDISEMVGFKPNAYYRICWRVVAPIFILTMLTMGLLSWQPLVIDYGKIYVYPMWGNYFGWAITMSSLIPIPMFAISKMVRCRGNLWERWRQATMPWSVRTIRNLPSRGGVKLDPKTGNVTIVSKPANYAYDDRGANFLPKLETNTISDKIAFVVGL